MARPRRSSSASAVSSRITDDHQELGSMYDYLAKIILIGPSGAGKSCLLHRFVRQSFLVLSSQTIGVEFSSKIIKIPSSSTTEGPRRPKRIKLQLWDTAGTERFRSVSRSYYRGAAGAILVYDVGSRRSLDALNTFLVDARALGSRDLVTMLAGNKRDVDQPLRQRQEEGRDVDEGNEGAGGSWKEGSGDAGGGGSGRFTGASVSYGGKMTATRAEGREVTAEMASKWASKAGVPVVTEVSALTGEGVDELFQKLARMILTKIELGEIDPDDPQSGIQYGDGGGWDGASTRSAISLDDGSLRRRGRRKGNNILREWEDVFRSPPGKRGRCC